MLSIPCPRLVLLLHASNFLLLLPLLVVGILGAKKVLIRRIQKLEKLTEDWEERTEVAKRKLKQHRREIWKKKEKKLTAKNISGGGWQFLPDAEVFEAQETESRKLPKGVVREAHQDAGP